VPGGRADLAEAVGGMRKQRQRAEHTGSDEERLRDGRVANRLGIGLGAVMSEIETGHR
jgi:hypothetical protein